MLTNTTEIGTATLPRRRLIIPAPTDVSPSAPRRPPRFPALAWAALALLGLLAHPSPASAQTDVWTATFTPAAFGSGFIGCANDRGNPTEACSNATVLSDDDFTHDSTDYSVISLFLSSGTLTLKFDTDITTATAALTLVVGTTSLALADASDHQQPLSGSGPARASRGPTAPPSASGSPSPSPTTRRRWRPRFRTSRRRRARRSAMRFRIPRSATRTPATR